MPQVDGDEKASAAMGPTLKAYKKASLLENNLAE